jgi:Family of unknown function (DUF5989)
MSENNTDNTPSPEEEEFSRLAEEKAPNALTEFKDFLLQNKKWWLTPVLLVLLAVAALIIFGSSSFAPLVYTIW